MRQQFFRLQADIDLDAIRKNIRAIKKGLRKGVKTCVVVKADAYGHGAVPVAEKISDLVDFYAVATVDEALELRENGIHHPILILGY